MQRELVETAVNDAMEDLLFQHAADHLQIGQLLYDEVDSFLDPDKAELSKPSLSH